jgi:hypothetical protein
MSVESNTPRRKQLLVSTGGFRVRWHALAWKLLLADVSNVEKLLHTANGAFPLITIHREKTDASACWIGRVVELVQDG